MIKSTDIEWRLKSIRNDIIDIEGKFASLIKERDNALITDVIVPMQTYPSAPSISYYDNYRGKYILYNKDKCLQLIETWWGECLAVAEHNDKIRPNNIAIRDKIINMMLTLGLKQTDRVKKSTRSSKYIDVTSAWYTAITTQIPTGGDIRYQETVKTDLLAKVAKDEADREKATAEAQRLREQDMAKKRSDVTFVELCQKTGIDPITSCKDDVLDVILSKDKYLRLGYYLLKNREDWNDGADFAERGLRAFDVVTKQDNDIYTEIDGHISDWCGDGRVFRDCTYNYDVLFGMADQFMVELYNKYLELQ